jgi:putative transposase
MFYRRKLPHWHPDPAEALFLFVTWRLAGSMPQTEPPQPSTRKPQSTGRAFLALDREVDKAAFGPVWLRDARVARVVAEARLYGESGRRFYQLRAWVIMPNHVPVVLRPMTSLPVIMRWLKGSSARQANLILGRTGQAFWQDARNGSREVLRSSRAG